MGRSPVTTIATTPNGRTSYALAGARCRAGTTSAVTIAANAMPKGCEMSREKIKLALKIAWTVALIGLAAAHIWRINQPPHAFCKPGACEMEDN